VRHAAAGGRQDVAHRLFVLFSLHGSRCLFAKHRTPEHLAATLRSPQFLQQVATFSMALQTGQLDLAQFGLQAKVRAGQGTTLAMDSRLACSPTSPYVLYTLLLPQGFSVADFLESVRAAANGERGTSGSAQPPASQPPNQP
jgi:hypothetical protein